jgi:YegS/Rv2252/BmrU family lipid kinase
MRLCVIFNPVAKGDKARKFRLALDQKLAAGCTLKPTHGPGAGRPLATEAVREGFDTIIAAGGDGTLNEVVNGIGDEPDGFERTRLGLLPLGTVNVFARELGIPLELHQAWDVAHQNHETRVDLGLAEFTRDGHLERQYFVQMGGTGLDARSIALVDWQHKKRVGALAYIFAGLKALRGPQPRIRVAGGGISMEGEMALIGNGRFYGGNFELFPRASNRDGILNATVFPRTNLWVLLRCGWGFITGRFEGAGGARHFQAPEFTLTSATPSVPLELEGDNVGFLPARFTVQSKRLRVLVTA